MKCVQYWFYDCVGAIEERVLLIENHPDEEEYAYVKAV